MKKDGFTTGDFRKASSERGRWRRWDTQKAGRSKVVLASPRRLPRLKTLIIEPEIV